MERTDEIWASIEGFPHYQISSYGSIYNSKARRNPRPYIHKNSGLLKVTLCHGNRRRDAYLHILVAEAFMGDFRPGLQIAHQDGNKLNNHVENLAPKSGREFAMARYQARNIRGGKVRVLETGQVFINAYSAARHYRTDPSTIYKVLRGERGRALGMRFEYYREGENLDAY